VAERLPLTLRGYRRLASAATPLTSILLAKRLKRGKEHPARIGERRGETAVPRPAGPLIWTHGASVGEMLSLMPLIEWLRGKGFAVLVTSGTLTSAKLAERRLPQGVIHQFIPIDAPKFIDRFLEHWRPNLALFSESDLWPNLIIESAGRGIPLILVNARLSEQSFHRWRYAPTTIASLLRRFDLCLAQSELDADRYAHLGAPRVNVTGNLKLDAPAPPADNQKLEAMQAAIAGRPVIAAASTHPGEEVLVIDAHIRLRHSFPRLITLIAPRHPERGPGILDLAKLAGFSAAMRSSGELPNRGTDVYVADTIGELGLLYRLAPIVFVGGSLVKHGGQNPIEPAKLDCAILHGPYVSNFAAIYADLNRARGAATVTDADSLTTSIERLLYDPNLVSQMAEAAHTTVLRLGGALERTYAAIEPYLVQLRLSN
jgi:3-deoxy-D-manno-octulosonic-acid transferase